MKKYIGIVVSIIVGLSGQSYAASGTQHASIDDRELSREQVMERWKSLPPEERERIKYQMRQKSKERWNDMTPDEQEKVRKRREANRALRQKLSGTHKR